MHLREERAGLAGHRCRHAVASDGPVLARDPVPHDFMVPSCLGAPLYDAPKAYKL